MRLKRFAAMAMSVVLAAASMPVTGLAAETQKWLASMELESDVTLLLGESKTLTPSFKEHLSTDSNAGVATAADALASASNALKDGTAKWESSVPGVVSVEDGTVTALKYDIASDAVNSSKISVTIDGEWMYNKTATTTVTVAKPELAVTLANEGKFAPGDDVEITPDLTNVAKDLKGVTYLLSSSDKNVIAVTEDQSKATVVDTAANNATADITVTAVYNSVEIAETTAKVTVVASPTENTLDWVDTAQLPIKLTINGEAADATKTVQFKSSYADGFIVKSSDENVAVAEISKEKEQENGYYYLVVTAKAAGTATLTLSHKDGVVKNITADVIVTDASKPVVNTLKWWGDAPEHPVVSLAINKGEETKLSHRLFFESNFTDGFEVTIDDPNVADAKIIIDEKGAGVKITAKAAGSAVITLSHEGVDPIKATVNVEDGAQPVPTLAWKAGENPVVSLLINKDGEEPNETGELFFESSFKDGFEVSIDKKEVADVEEIKNDEKGTGIKITAKAVGVATITLSHEGVDPITATVSVTDAKADEPEVKVPEEAKPEVEGLPKTPEEAAEMADEAVEDALTNVDNASEFTEEHKAELKNQTAEMLTNLNKTMNNKELAKVTLKGDFKKALAEQGVELKPGQTVAIGLKQTFDMGKSELKVEFNEEGKPVSYFTSLSFDVTPTYEIFNGDTSIDKQDFADGTKLSGQVTFTLPIPDASAEKFAYNMVEHEHKERPKTWYTGRIGGKGTWRARVTTDEFSPFTLIFTDEAPSTSGSGWVKPAGGSGSGSGSSTGTNMNAKGGKSGQWQQNETGWWFRYTDGTYPRNEWVELEWQNVKNWYYFNAEGYIETGWKQDGSTWYYLHDVSDGTLGHMYTGWHQIGGKWYYFSTVAGGPLGAMLSNTTTPDGFQLGADGAWIQ